MSTSGLYDLIKYLERGTKMHIGVLFFGAKRSRLCLLPHEHEIHSSPICSHFKKNAASFRRCCRCRNMALRRALTEKVPFGGYCVNGIFEYTYPIVRENKVLAVIFVGNIYAGGEENQRLHSRIKDAPELLKLLEHNFREDELCAVAEIIENYILMLFERDDGEAEKKNTLIENVKGYIRSNSEFDIGTEHIAAIFHYNKSYLGRLFKQETGMSVAEYLQSRRLETAKALLTETGLTVLEIALRTGFSSVSYFNRTFKAHVGKTPTEYRRGELHDRELTKG